MVLFVRLRVCLSHFQHACTDGKAPQGAGDISQEHLVFVQNSSVGDPAKGLRAEATAGQVISEGQACPEGFMCTVCSCLMRHSCLYRGTVDL